MNQTLHILREYRIVLKKTFKLICLQLHMLCREAVVAVLEDQTTHCSEPAYHPAVQCSAVQCSAVQCSAVQCSAVQCSAVQCRAGQCSAVQCWVCN
jgi:hypothetical protein